MENACKLVAAIHDLSGFGRCSLSVIIPSMSAMGIQVCAVPTAILSTHTGGMGEVELHDLTEYPAGALSHYKRLGLSFDCVYSGFLSNQEQIDHCLQFFAEYPAALHVVDPVMGDHGRPYRTVTPRIRVRMKELVKEARIITPNLTEASMLLDTEYPREPLSQSAAKSLLARLGEKGPSQVVITGITLATGELANIGYDRQKGAYWRVVCEYVPVNYPGTGDLFASVLTGALLCGDSLPLAVSRATAFVQLCIKTTYGYGSDPRFGVLIEKNLHHLTRDETSLNYTSL
jgi:pyridoxine kinase